MDFEMNKKAQVSIFVVLALIIVAAIILFFLIFRSGDASVSVGQEFDNPESFIDKCLRDSVRETVSLMAPQGGFVNPEDYKLYNDVKATYLCKNVNYYEPCIMQYPRYITQLQEELNKEIKDEVEECFILLEEELEQRNYDYSGGEIEIEAALKPGIIEVTVYRDFTFSRNEITRSFESFTVGLNNALYDISYVANEIASQEAKFCYFENAGFNALYPEFDVRKTVMSDSTEIYTIKHKSTGDEMNIAIRGCAIPGGF